MKKQLLISLGVALLAIANVSMMNAQPAGYYKEKHINQNFDGLEALPDGWSWRSDNSTIYTRGGGNLSVTDGMLKSTSSAAGGNRGIDLLFPTPSIEVSETWFIELDWVINSAMLGPKNALNLIFSGSKSENVNTADTWYADGIFGIYTFGDGYLHYWNLDQEGPLDETTEDPNDHYGPAFISGTSAGFRRAAADAETAASINASTKTNVAYAAGKTYHITAELNFTTQQVVSLTITDKDDATNTQTFGTQAFLAPTLGGSASSVAVENRIVTDLAVLSCVNTRANNTGTNGNSVTHEIYLDNLEIYYLKESLGQADVTIHYKDRDGNQAKASRVAPQEEITAVYSLLLSDKERFIEGNNYYAYDAEATHTANAGKGNGDGESVTVAAGGVSLDVIFKKSPVTGGTYIWTGGYGFNWDELEENFNVNGTNLSFQNGNAATFSGAGVINKEIQVPSALSLGEGDMTVSAEGYSFTGNGRLEGSGTLILDKPAILGIDNRLEGGALVNTTGDVYIKHASAAAKFKLIDNASLKLEAGANFNKPIEGSGGAVNFDVISDNTCSPAITGVSTINIQLTAPGRYSSAAWTTNWSGAGFPENAKINVTNHVETGRKAGFGVGKTTLENVKVHLGDSVRLVREYNEGSGGTDVVVIGEISGTAAALIEGGFVDGRQQTYQVGGLNTDAVFAGTIRQYAPTDSTFSTSTLHLVKAGTGKWTVMGDLLFSGDLTVEAGTLALGGFVDQSVTQIKVDTAATLQGYNAVVATGVDVNIATLSGSLDAYSLALTGSTLKLYVNSFTEDDHDKIITQGDFTTIPALGDEQNILDISVNAATQGAKVQLIEVLGNPDITFDQIKVNGVDITENTADTPGAEFVWDNDTFELLSLINKEGSVIDETLIEKTIRSTQYYDLAGRVTTKDAKGFVIKKITYTDGTQAVQKAFVLAR
ncbi:MAG: hypothetical protein LBP72_07120 [Dysgonamonadaceae bacterium]|jgi:autotransporter-associated beta strand protein|nr:hypothetical protein [Dysgonamonadaceae bacterium]